MRYAKPVIEVIGNAQALMLSSAKNTPGPVDIVIPTVMTRSTPAYEADE